MIYATIVKEDKELQQILELQQKNLIRNISATEIESQGFVTLHHTPAVLQQMHELAPSIIVKDEDKVVGYALTMLRECRQIVPDLESMFTLLDQLSWRGKPLNDLSYYVMGQICIDKAYRGQGLFEKLYHHHKERYQSTFDCIVTEIALRNHRSLRAHERVGFQTMHTHKDELDEWAVVVWDW